MALSTPELQGIEAEAVEVAGLAGSLLAERFRNPMVVEYKGKGDSRDPVTDADRASEELLQRELGRRFPGHVMVGEEGAGTGRETSPLTWVVDPLDGTTNYLNGLPFFACSIALLEEGRPVVAAVYLPWPGMGGGRVLHASRGGGAWVEGERLKVAGEASPRPGRLAVLSGVYGGRFRLLDALRRSPGERRSVGSTAYELALVADGTYQYALFASPRSWDVAAGTLLVTEAGGAVLGRGRGSREWKPLARFGGEGDGAPSPEALREWRGSFLAGNPAIVGFVAGQVRPRWGWRERARRALGLGRDRRRG